MSEIRLPYPNRGGSTYTSGVPRYRGEPLLRCPITGLLFPLSEGRLRNGAFVSAEGYDEPGNREVVRATGRIPVRRRIRRRLPRQD